MLHSNRRQVVRTPKQQRNKKDTTYMQILLLLLLLLPFSASSCPAGTWHFRLRLCPHAPSLLLTHTAHSKNTGAGENEPTTRHVPSYDVRTRTHLAGGRRPASAATSALHSRRRRLDPRRISRLAATPRSARASPSCARGMSRTGRTRRSDTSRLRSDALSSSTSRLNACDEPGRSGGRFI